jgi:hypothetical protein
MIKFRSASTNETLAIKISMELNSFDSTFTKPTLSSKNMGHHSYTDIHIFYDIKGQRGRRERELEKL